MSTRTPVTDRAETLLTTFQALSDANRLRVLHILRGGERCVRRLVEVLGISQRVGAAEPLPL